MPDETTGGAVTPEPVEAKTAEAVGSTLKQNPSSEKVKYFTDPDTQQQVPIDAQLYDNIKKNNEIEFYKKIEKRGLLLTDEMKTEYNQLKESHDKSLVDKEKAQKELMLSQGKHEEVFNAEKIKFEESLTRQKTETEKYKHAYQTEKNQNVVSRVETEMRSVLSKIPNILPEGIDDTITFLKNDFTINENQLVIKDGNGGIAKAENGIDSADPLPKIQKFLETRPNWFSAQKPTSQPALGKGSTIASDKFEGTLADIARMNQDRVIIDYNEGQTIKK